MASRAFARSSPISYYISPVDFPAFCMTKVTRHLFVGAGQRERARRLVIEQCRRPADRVMARPAIHRFRALLELPRMDIFMAPDALFRRRLESNDSRMRVGIRGAMTIHTAHHAVPPHQCE